MFSLPGDGRERAGCSCTTIVRTALIPVSHRFCGCVSVNASSGALVTLYNASSPPFAGSVDSSLVSEPIWAWSLIQIRLIERDDVRRLV